MHVRAPLALSYVFSLHTPLSMTYTMPSMVMEVSAMLVATMHRRVPSGAFWNTRACSAIGIAA
jgi:hypothetical protein